MSSSPLRALIGQSLAPASRRPGIVDTSELHLALFEAAASLGAEAIAGSGVGVDHFAGERILASILLRDTPKGHEHRLPIAITDRGTYAGGSSTTVGGFNSYRWAFPHTHLGRVEVSDSMLKQMVTLHADRPYKLPIHELVKPVGAMYRTLATQIPPEQRVEPPTPFVEPSEGDPAGARGAIAGLFVEDPRAAAMLETIDADVRSGAMDADRAADLTARVLLAHRSRAGGPGMREGAWINPMSAQDFGHALVRVLGNPLGHTQPQPGMDALVFAIDPRRDVFGAALAGLGMAAYLTVGVGFAPTKMLANALITRSKVTRIVVYFSDRPSHCLYRLEAQGGTLASKSVTLAHGFHQAMIGVSYAVLERRCQRGSEIGFDELMA